MMLLVRIPLQCLAIITFASCCLLLGEGILRFSFTSRMLTPNGRLLGQSERLEDAWEKESCRSRTGL